jgi:hypothetical protein
MVKGIYFLLIKLCNRLILMNRLGIKQLQAEGQMKAPKIIIDSKDWNWSPNIA